MIVEGEKYLDKEKKVKEDINRISVSENETIGG